MGCPGASRPGRAGVCPGRRGRLVPARRPSSPQRTLPLLTQDAVANHMVYSADKRRPTELGATQRDDLARWVSNRLNHPVAPPDLSAEGYSYMGGRLAATSDGPAGCSCTTTGRACGSRCSCCRCTPPPARRSSTSTSRTSMAAPGSTRISATRWSATCPGGTAPHRRSGARAVRGLDLMPRWARGCSRWAGY